MKNFNIWLKQSFRYKTILSVEDALFYQKYEDDIKQKREFDKKLFYHLKNKIKNSSIMIKFVRWGDAYYNIVPKVFFITVVEQEDAMLEKALNKIFSIVGEIKDGLVLVIEGNGFYFEDQYYLSIGFKYV